MAEVSNAKPSANPGGWHPPRTLFSPLPPGGRGTGTATHLYQTTLGFRVNDVEAKYYADNEDAYGHPRPRTGSRGPMGDDAGWRFPIVGPSSLAAVEGEC